VRALDQGAVSRLAQFEVLGALARLRRADVLTPAIHRELVARLEEDYGRLLVVELTSELGALTSRLLQNHPLRSSDAIQLATCLDLGRRLNTNLQMAVFDKRLRQAAQVEGLDLLPGPDSCAG
jgi:uncharacterized protein